ncbi:MAG: hypothetical protein RMJ33_04265 [Saprospiraceae bacterium]|nr:hypothetical protein [Saprospiraceae bacterium]MDW8229032.1 hypothetical protein [Saprospiraceae bacterium]
MKKSILNAIILTIIAIQGHGQKPCDIINHYEDFISIKKSTFNHEVYLTVRAHKTQKEICFSGLVNNNPLFIDYLLINFASRTNSKNLLEFTDSIEIKDRYFNSLKRDSAFNAIMVDLVNKTIDNKTPKEIVSMEKLLNVAVKYFSIVGFNEEGNYIGRVCIGLNEVEKTEIERQPFLEAFSFSSILKHCNSEEYDICGEFSKAIQELYKVNLGVNEDEKLSRAQGVIFILMANNENLKKMLRSEYEKQKKYLPFLLEEN